MKKKDAKKLKLNLVIILSLVLCLCLTVGLILSVSFITQCVVKNKTNVIAYKETVGYMYIIIPAIILSVAGFTPYSILEQKLNNKKKNQKIPSHRKIGKGEILLKKIKIAFTALNILLVLLTFPICVNARQELHYDGIYKITITGREKLICPRNEITGFRIQVGKSRRGKNSRYNYYPEVVTITAKKNFYFPRYTNQNVKKEFFLSIKNNPSAEINLAGLKKYYNFFSEENQQAVDLLLND